MAKETITSTDWHLEGVSVEVRTAIKSLAAIRGSKQGVLVDELLRKSPELAKLMAVLPK